MWYDVMLWCQFFWPRFSLFSLNGLVRTSAMGAPHVSYIITGDVRRAPILICALSAIRNALTCRDRTGWFHHFTLHTSIASINSWHCIGLLTVTVTVMMWCGVVWCSDHEFTQHINADAFARTAATGAIIAIILRIILKIFLF